MQISFTLLLFFVWYHPGYHPQLPSHWYRAIHFWEVEICQLVMKVRENWKRIRNNEGRMVLNGNIPLRRLTFTLEWGANYQFLRRDTYTIYLRYLLVILHKLYWKGGCLYIIYFNLFNQDIKWILSGFTRQKLDNLIIWKV